VPVFTFSRKNASYPLQLSSVVVGSGFRLRDTRSQPHSTQTIV